MLLSLISLSPSPNEADGGSRQRRRRRHQSKPIQPIHDEPGRWIWSQGPEAPRNFYLYARKTFKLSAKPTKATIKASAENSYKLYVNGGYVGKGPVRSGEGYTYYDTFDITEFLNKGNNVIAFHVHYIGESTYSSVPSRPGLICKAEIETGEEVQIVATDETWKVRRAEDWTDAGARLCKELGFQEVYDARVRIDDWCEVKCSEKDWEAAQVVGDVPSMPWGRLIEREIPMLVEEKILPSAIVGTFNSPPRSIETPPGDVPELMAAGELYRLKDGGVKGAEELLSEAGETQVKTPRSDVGVVLILDFGREISGNVEISVAGSGSGCIDLGYSETLQDGRVKPNRSSVNYTDRVHLKSGRIQWQSFAPRSFRYMQLEFRRFTKAVTLEYIRVNETLYPSLHRQFRVQRYLIERDMESRSAHDLSVHAGYVYRRSLALSRTALGGCED